MDLYPCLALIITAAAGDRTIVGHPDHTAAGTTTAAITLAKRPAGTFASTTSALAAAAIAS
ncbi:MAG: hypothetical protein INR71_10755, partial [Terriglobus roseus]|nr:hypothetical protein [Terriglobus roseus]